MTQEDRDLAEGRLRREIRGDEMKITCLQIRMTQRADDLLKIVSILQDPGRGTTIEGRFGLKRGAHRNIGATTVIESTVDYPEFEQLAKLHEEWTELMKDSTKRKEQLAELEKSK